MKKKDYLLFHAQTLFKLSQDHHIDLVYSDNIKKIKLNHYPSHSLGSISIIKNDTELYNYFQNNIYIKDPEFFSESLLKILFFNGSEEQINYFLKHNKSIHASIYLFTINSLLPLLTESLILKIFKDGSTTFPFIHEKELENTILILKNDPKITFDIAEVLAAYILKNYNNLQTEYSKVCVRNLILEYFPNDLTAFEKLPFINDYLKFNDTKSSSLIVEQKSLFYCTSLSLNIPFIQNKYILSRFTSSSHLELLSLFFNILEKKCNHPNIVKIFIENKLNDNNLYVILKTEDPNFSFFLNNIVSDYYSYILTIESSNSDWDWDILDDLTEHWIKAKLSHDKLEKELIVKESLFIKNNKI